jgi:predicted ester cyclase
MDDPQSLIQHGITLWNARDREGFTLLVDERVEIEGPGGLRLSGIAGWGAFWDLWNDAFPDNAVEASAFGDGEQAAEEGRFVGTHTGTLRTPGGDLPPTGRTVDVPYALIFRVTNGKVTFVRLYFDQVELLTQLGLIPELATGSAAL